jgi:hypothetical protein
MNIHADDYLETGDIAAELQKLGGSGVLPERTLRACTQGAWILRRLREIVFLEKDSRKAIDHLSEILCKHHDG